MDAGGQGRGKCYEVGGANWQEGGGMQITEQNRSRARAWVSETKSTEGEFPDGSIKLIDISRVIIYVAASAIGKTFASV